MSTRSEFITKVTNTIDAKDKTNLADRLIETNKLIPYLITKVKSNNLETVDITLLKNVLLLTAIPLKRVQQITNQTFSEPLFYALVGAYPKYVDLYSDDTSDEHVKSLLNLGPHGNTSLHLAASQDMFDVLSELIDKFSPEQQKKLLNSLNTKNRTITSMAIERNCFTFVEKYLGLHDKEAQLGVFTEKLEGGQTVFFECIKASTNPAEELPKYFKLLADDQRMDALQMRDEYAKTIKDYLTEQLGEEKTQSILAAFLTKQQIAELS